MEDKNNLYIQKNKYEEAVNKINTILPLLEELKTKLSNKDKFDGIEQITKCISNVDSAIEFLNSAVSNVNTAIEKVTMKINNNQYK